MTVRELMVALIGMPADAEVEVHDVDGVAASLTKVGLMVSLGARYVQFEVDRMLVADDETVVKAA